MIKEDYVPINLVVLFLSQHEGCGQWWLRSSKQSTGRCLSRVLDWLERKNLCFLRLLGADHLEMKPTAWDVVPPKEFFMGLDIQGLVICEESISWKPERRTR